jgi:formylglycine-generating enzyme required for sulfatase activity
MVQIPAGKFIMGDKDEVDAPPHEVIVDAFLMDARLVTQDLFQKIMGTNPSRWKGRRESGRAVALVRGGEILQQALGAEGLQPCYDLAL